jgi:hypothetical protein
MMTARNWTEQNLAITWDQNMSLKDVFLPNIYISCLFAFQQSYIFIEEKKKEKEMKVPFIHHLFLVNICHISPSLFFFWCNFVYVLRLLRKFTPCFYSVLHHKHFPCYKHSSSGWCSLLQVNHPVFKKWEVPLLSTFIFPGREKATQSKELRFLCPWLYHPPSMWPWRVTSNCQSSFFF